MKKKYFNLFLCFVFGFSACGSVPRLLQSQAREPEVSVNSVNVAEISLQGVNLLVHVDVENPNSSAIPPPKIDWELFINEASFSKGTVNNSRSIAGRGKATLDFPVNIGYEGLFNAFASVANADEAAYKIAIAVAFDIPALEENVYHLSHSGTFPVIKTPGVSFRGITRKSLGPTMEFIITWDVENRNNFDFSLAEFDYDFSVNNSQWAKGQVENPPVIRAKARTSIPLTVSVSAPAIIRELVNVLNRGSAVNYACTGNMQFQGNFPGLEKFEFPLDLRGSTPIR